MKTIRFWLNNARTISLPQSLLPALTAVAASVWYDDFSWAMALLAVLGVLMAHLGMNLADDYFDYHQKTAEIRGQLTKEGQKVHIKCHYLLSGEATTKQLLLAFCIFLALAGLMGGILFYLRGWPILLLAGIGLLLGISYSAPPLKLGYRGLGELVIGLMFGPLLMIGVQYASCGIFDMRIVLLSLAVGLLVTNIVYSHAIMDTKADEANAKMTFARLLKHPFAIIVASGVFNVLPFLLVIGAVLFGYLQWPYLIVCLLLPQSVYLVYSLNCFLHDRPALLSPRWWMGPMGDFEKYQSANMDWFLIRWLLARNIVSFFCLICIVVGCVC